MPKTSAHTTGVGFSFTGGIPGKGCTFGAQFVWDDETEENGLFLHFGAGDFIGLGLGGTVDYSEYYVSSVEDLNTSYYNTGLSGGIPNWIIGGEAYWNDFPYFGDFSGYSFSPWGVSGGLPIEIHSMIEQGIYIPMNIHPVQSAESCWGDMCSDFMGWVRSIYPNMPRMY